MSDDFPKRAGESDTEFAKRLFDHQDAEAAARLNRAREEAAARGKEPFDLDRLEAIWKPFSYGRFFPARETRQEEWENRYYLEHPEIMTLAEFARRMKEYDDKGYFE
jgi:hypothetical protein